MLFCWMSIRGVRSKFWAIDSLVEWRGPIESSSRLPEHSRSIFAIEGHVPWTNPDCARAGTVHLAGGFDEIVAAERETNSGRMPDRPFVLLGQQYLADPTRSAGNIHPLYAYAHVPHGYAGDATEAIIRQIERFAPGFRDQIVGDIEQWYS